MSTQTDMKPLLFSLADAIETDLVLDSDLVLGVMGTVFTGSRTGLLELFEGYSPVIVSSIDRTLWDIMNNVVAADQHIFGNVGAITVVEGQQSTIHCFVYDRVLAKDPNYEPWKGNGWSRRHLYSWLECSVKAIYHRSIFDTKWQQLEGAHKKLSRYNKDRDAELGAKFSYTQMWEAS